MRIRRLDICGFKSFMDRMTFVFDDGITGVVGPNGCGKSNVVDAIRWVMGEQSAKHLRGKSMEDVIFNGSEHHAPLGMAEVTLTFLNDGSMPLPPQYSGFPEITVTRRLFRNGDSEYVINKAVVRLLDVTELFLGTGVGTKAYSIIEQGRIGLIVSAKPEDRKALIEEAAGITKYKSRRKQAERKMEYTQQNLLRVGDILGELEKRLETLQRQARKTEKYKALKAEMKETELHLSASRWLQLSDELEAANARIEKLTSQEQEVGERLRAVESEIEQERAATQFEEQRLVAETERLFGLENQAQVAAANLEFSAREETDARERIAQSHTEQQQLGSQREALEAESEAARLEVERLGSAVEQAQASVLAAEQAAKSLVEESQGSARRLDEERAALVEVMTRLAQQQSNLANLTRQKLELTSRLGWLEGEAHQLSGQIHRLETEREALAIELGATRQLKLTLDTRRSTEEGVLAETRARFVEQEAGFIRLREELSERRSRLTSLEEIHRNYENFDRGVRAVMLRADEAGEEAGIEGLVADLIGAAQPEHEKALEAALGQRLQAIVVESREKGLEAVEFLRSGNEGRSAFVPLDAELLGEEAPSSFKFQGFIARAMDVVRHAPKHAQLVKALLGQVLLVRDLEKAVSAVGLGRFTFVTPTGEVLDPQGVLTGGTLEGPGAGALQRKREIQDLADQVALLETRVAQAQHEHELLGRRSHELESSLKGLQQDAHDKELFLVEKEKDLSRAAQDVTQLRSRLQGVDAERESLARKEKELEREESAGQGVTIAGETERQGREAKVTELAQAVEAFRARSEAQSAEATSLKVQVAAEAERRDAALRSQTRLQQSHQELSERTSRLAEQVAEAEARVAELTRKRSEAESERERAQSEAGTLSAQLTADRATQLARHAALTEKEVGLKQLRRDVESASEERQQLTLAERERQMQRVVVSQQIQERYQLDLGAESERFRGLPAPGPEQEERLLELRGQVDRMGEINLTAIDEFAEHKGRFDFLTQQKKDLDDSLEQLRKAINKIDATSQLRFQETFDLVNERFQAIFPRLFAGGKARLELTKNPTTGELGMEILAQPPGKATKSIDLFSGGEKALTAVSLIFAIFLIKPTPFCLLDEVDAPLDDANVGRYNEMIREMSSASQFILITHNKRTMEISDTLYGVTMEEPGVSKLVSVKLSEAARSMGVA